MKTTIIGLISSTLFLACFSSPSYAQETPITELGVTDAESADLNAALVKFEGLRLEYSLKQYSELQTILTDKDIDAFSRISASTDHIALWKESVQYIGHSEPSERALEALKQFLSEPVNPVGIESYDYRKFVFAKGVALRYLELMNDKESTVTLRALLETDFARQFASPWIDWLPAGYKAKRSFILQNVIYHAAVGLVYAGDKEGIDKIEQDCDGYEREPNKTRYQKLENITEADYVLRDKYRIFVSVLYHIRLIERFGLNRAVGLELPSPAA